MLTYSLFKTQSMLLSATSRKGQPDAHLHPVQKPKGSLVSNREGDPDAHLHPIQNPDSCQQQGGRASDMLTYILLKTKRCSCQQQAGRDSQMLTYILFKPRGCSCQQQSGRASQMLTYKLFKTQTTLLSAINRRGQPDADLHPVQNPDHAFVSSTQEGPARC